MCQTALTIKNRYTDEYSTVPCQKCPECRARRASAWSFRLRQEDKISHTAYFLTLTYDTLHVPITAKNRMSLSKGKRSHLQLFFKRLRKAHEQHHTGTSIKYYAVGEYGGTTHRPHYHVIIFNAQLNLMVNRTDLLKLHYTNYDGYTEVICNQWNNGRKGKHKMYLGHMTVGQVTPASVGYTLKYISKPKTVPQYKGDDRIPEFSVMSKLLGVNYLTQAMKRWHTADLKNRMYCVIEDGVKISMPRYYKDKLYNNEQRETIKQYFFEKYITETIETFNSPTYQKDARDKKEAIKASIRWNKLSTKKTLL